jgi:hypothetical protein
MSSGKTIEIPKTITDDYGIFGGASGLFQADKLHFLDYSFTCGDNYFFVSFWIRFDIFTANTKQTILSCIAGTEYFTYFMQTIAGTPILNRLNFIRQSTISNSVSFDDVFNLLI